MIRKFAYIALFILFAVACICIAGVALLAQDSAVSAETVTVPLVVADGSDKFAENFPAEYLTVTEDGKPVHVTDLQFDREEPLYVAVLMEYSNHLPISPAWHGYWFPTQEVIYQAGMTIFSLATRLGEDDRIALILYGNRRHLEQDFTTNKQDVIDKVEELLNASVGPIDNEATLYAGIAETLAKLKGKAKGRKLVLLVVGTGQDTLGGTTLDEAMQAARESSTQVFFVQVGWDLVQLAEVEDQKSVSATGRHTDPFANNGPESEYRMLFFSGRAIATASGGFAVEQRAVGQGSEIAESVVLWARSTHRLTYEAPALKADGKLHKIKVSFNRKLLGPDGKEFKAKGITVDGRRTPKPKKGERK